MLRWWWCCVHRKLSQVSVHSHYCGLSCDFWNSRSRKKRQRKRRRKESSLSFAAVAISPPRFLPSFFCLLIVIIGHYHHSRVPVSNVPRERETLFCSRYILWFSLLLTCFIISSDCGCSIGKYLWMNLHNWWGRRAREAKKRSTTESARREERRSKATTNSEWIEEEKNTRNHEKVSTKRRWWL